MDPSQLHTAAEPKARIVKITPGTARELLARNTHNRPITKARVTALRKDMLQGRWQYNGEALKWATTGELLDGQHRLHALSGIQDPTFAVQFLVVEGLDPAAQNSMDQGKSRSAADMLGLTDIGDSRSGGRLNTLAAAIRIYIEWEGDRMFTRNKATNTEVVEWAQNNPDEYAKLESFHTTDLNRAKARPSIVIACRYIFDSIDPDAADKFMRGFVTGIGITSELDPILTLRNRLDRENDAKGIRDVRNNLALMFMAWNAYREGRTLARLIVNPSWNADTFPRPH